MELRIDLQGLAVNELADVLKGQADALAASSAKLMRKWGLPPLYGSHIRPQLDPDHGSGVERFRLPIQTFRQGWGDCDALSVYRAAERIAAGQHGSVRIDWTGPEMHARVRLSPTVIEDPWKIIEQWQQQNGARAR
jgi:hypothetical protein